MRLLNSLFHIDNTDLRASAIESNIPDIYIRLNPEHFIYKAHFPGKPVTPGVVIIQIILEILSFCRGKEFQIDSVDNAKFLSIISPENPGPYKVRFKTVKNDEAMHTVKIKAEILDSQSVYAKVSLTCKYC